jgi:microcin C transport system permease protein
MFRISPITQRKLRRFRQIKRGYYSLLILLGALCLSGLLELMINNKALVVSYEGNLFFPTYTGNKVGSDYGLEGNLANLPVNYRDLKKHFAEQDAGNWVLMPFIPYGANENNTYEGFLKPQPPTLSERHLLGTDTTGRDIFARLLYGFRIAIVFSLTYTFFVFLIGITIGCLMGYYGGWVDLAGQRMIEVWSNLPFLYTVIIIFSVVPSSLGIGSRIFILLLILVSFSWMGLTYYMRTGTYREKARDYTAAAKVLGAGSRRVIFKHILPNSIATIITFIPFTVVGGITAITALDFLGFGLPPPTPSMGELLKQGVSNLTIAPWIVTSAFVALVITLTLVTFVGEAVREAFDPKKFTIYQ